MQKFEKNNLAFRCGRVLGGIIIERVKSGVDRRLRSEMAGYRKGRRTTDQIFIIKQVSEWQATLYLNFVDFKKAFDFIYRESL